MNVQGSLKETKPVAHEIDRVPLFGCTFDRVNLDQAIQQVEEAIAD